MHAWADACVLHGMCVTVSMACSCFYQALQREQFFTWMEYSLQGDGEADPSEDAPSVLLTARAGKLGNAGEDDPSSSEQEDADMVQTKPTARGKATAKAKAKAGNNANKANTRPLAVPLLPPEA